VHVVYDSVGRDTFGRSLDCLRPRGYLVLYGQSSGRVEPVDPQTLNQKASLFLTRAHARPLHPRPCGAARPDRRPVRLAGPRELEVRVDRRWPLAEAAAAHAFLQARQATGKLLLLP
jgi:NADPH2:quinone reductase